MLFIHYNRSSLRLLPRGRGMGGVGGEGVKMENDLNGKGGGMSFTI